MLIQPACFIKIQVADMQKFDRHDMPLNYLCKEESHAEMQKR